jgi:hypothetical protein
MINPDPGIIGGQAGDNRNHMPVLTRWFLKSALLFFILAVLLGMLLAARAPLNSA